MKKTYIIKPQGGLKLRKIGRQHVIVKACDGNVNMSNVYSLNRTAAELWEQLEKGNSTVEGLAEWLCGRYEVEKSAARQDVERQLAEWEGFGLIAPAH